MNRNAPHPQSLSRGFTMIELLVASAVLVIMLGIIVSVTNQTTDVWRKSNARIESFQGARHAFSSITQLLSQATLNTYWDYDDPNAPSRYVRQSELHFIVDEASTLLPSTGDYSGQAIFFQTPSNRSSAAHDGMTGLLNACGFWVEYGSNADWLPAHLDVSTEAKERYRLFQWVETSEELATYAPTAATKTAWIQPDKERNAHPVADNIIALIIWPRNEDVSNPVLNQYRYNSREQSPRNGQLDVEINQLPPLVEIALVAIDESSAVRLGESLETEITACLKDLFATTPSADFASDFTELESRLADRNINFRILTTVIPMKEAKWSAQ